MGQLNAAPVRERGANSRKPDFDHREQIPKFDARLGDLHDF